jgi:hypothetical protein
MDNKEMVIIENNDGTIMEVELVTYLVSDDRLNTYVVYSKGETSGVEADEVIYISKVIKQGDILQIEEIGDDEWAEVQRLLKKIANV